MIEVASVAFNKVLEMDKDQTIGECEFNVYGTAKTLLNKVNKIIYKNGEVTDSDGEWIVSILLNVKRSELKSNNLVVTKEINDKAIEIAKKRASGTPLWYIIGETEFYGYKIKVDKNVLIPRPETEELCYNALKEITENSTVLDMCTGSGAIAITINKQSGAVVTAVDVSENALEVARENAIINDAKVEFILSDMFSNVDKKYDFILSNPPYIKTGDLASLQEEVKREPSLALDGGEDGLNFYRILSENSHKFLNFSGTMFMEIGIEQEEDVIKLFLENGNYKSAEAIKDINGINRIIKVVRNDV
jgi:release factor glutamine methyltransferase